MRQWDTRNVGCPIDSYTLFEAMLLGRTDFAMQDEAVERFLEALDRFSAFAFILHDPQAHAGFGERLDRDFEELDHTTGADLLFFALCRPQERWHSRTRERVYMQRLQRLASVPRAVTDLSANLPSNSLMARALATALQIPYAALPVIVMTQDPLDGGFSWVSTNEDHIGRQLNRLGFIAAQLSRGEDPGPLDELFRALDPGFSAQQLQLTRPLAEALAGVLAVEQVGSQFYDPLRRVAFERLQSAVLHTHEQMRRLRADAPRTPEGDEAFLAMLTETGVMLAVQLGRPDHPGAPDGQARVGPEGIEPLTSDLLGTAGRVLPVLRAMPGTNDFSPFVLCLSKALEVELNQSVVQWVRCEMGIEMPRFFGAPAPGGRRYQLRVREREQGVNVNARRAGQWLPLSLGAALVASGHMVGNGAHPPGGFFEEHWDRFARDCDEVRQARNRCAHVHLLHEGDAATVSDRHERMQTNGSWSGMVRLKSLLRGDGGADG